MTADGSVIEANAGLRRELVRTTIASGIYIAGDGLARAVSLVLTVAYTHYLTPGNYGTLAVASTVLLLLPPILGLSISAATLRLWFESEERAARDRLVGATLAFLLVVATVAAAAIELLGDLGVLDFVPSAHYAPYLRYAMLTAYFSVFLDLPVTLLIARRRPKQVLALTVAGAAATLGTSLGLVVGLHEGVVGVLRANAISAAAMAVIGVVVTLRMSHGRLRWAGDVVRPSLRYSVPLVPGLLAQWVLQVSDRPLLSHFVAAAAVGRYYLGYSIGAIAGLVVHGATRALQPLVTRDLKQGLDARVARTGTYWFGALTLVCLAIAVWGSDLLYLVTAPRFHTATRIVPVVAAAHVAFAAYVIVGQGIFYGMRTRWLPALTGAAALVNVGLNVLLVPRWGIMAAAVDTAAGFTTLFVLFALHAHRVYRIDWEYLRWARIVLAAVAAFGVASVAGQAPSWARLGLELAGILLVAPLALTVLGFWTREERQAIASASGAWRGRGRGTRAPS